MFGIVLSRYSSVGRQSVSLLKTKRFVVFPSSYLDEKKKLPTRSIHACPKVLADATPVTTSSGKESIVEKISNRYTTTLEVTVSKIFPAGFGWQTSSIFAENVMGYQADSMAFACTTGLGDGVGVLLGHCGYFGLKKSITNNPDINMTREIHTGVLLGSAAFCSGTVWQPIVNALQGANLSFSEVFAGTWVGCGAAFYLGLRAARTVLSGFLSEVHEPTYKNSQTDAWLSLSIGGATGFFVGTDAAYLPNQNFLIDIVGITDSTPDIMGCAIAGSSTSLGFMSAQMAQNTIIPKGKCWAD